MKKREYEEIKEKGESFLKENPSIAEALNLFKISNHVYQEALSILHGPRVVVTNCTTTKDPSGDLG